MRVPVVPDRDAQPNECFLNTSRKVSRDGGAIVYGWCIWELPGLFIEGECHSVWRAPSGELADVTPKIYGESEILFLPDESVSFDEKLFNRQDNRRLAIRDAPAVHEFLKASAELIEYIERTTNPTNPRFSEVDRFEYGRLMEKKAALQIKMMSLPIGRNDICRCGSAEKYKKCCGR